MLTFLVSHYSTKILTVTFRTPIVCILYSIKYIRALTCPLLQALVWESSVSCGGPSFEDVVAEKIHIRPYNHPESLLALRLLKAQSIGASCYLQPYLPSIEVSVLAW